MLVKNRAEIGLARKILHETLALGRCSERKTAGRFDCAAVFLEARTSMHSKVRTGMTCWRRLRDWQNAGIWELIHFSLLDWLARYGRIDWSRAVLDSCSIRAVFGGFKQVLILPTEPNSVASVT